MKKLHILLTCSSLVLIALSINRLSSLFLGHIGPIEFLRWTDFNAMLIIPLATVVIYFLLKRNVELNSGNKAIRWSLALNILFIIAVYIFGTSSGDHETTNYLHGRFCDVQQTGATLCNIIAYHDDVFGHYLYYFGNILLGLILLATEYGNPRKVSVSKKDVWLILVNALVIALAVFANLAFEPAKIDLLAFTILAVLSAVSFIKNRSWARHYPLTIYLAFAYGIGLLATLAYKLVH
jgi:hypothetical protein